ncbi:glycoside hydrolase family protein [Desulfobacula phenolica]|uniref:Lysozyme n=1 Tax=Desulfobacula phenolica TaxID=90732 RepID=A0A1H2JQ13_9BACT|nr:lysozyme [Desulfobacula phenolica]SDU58510.1 Phage-related lysozyme (muramidase), GH24 family [Desulfobacula phenolica]
MNKIIGSVGRNGKNLPADVALIQKLLNAQKIPGQVTPLKVDGKMGSKTISRIEVFQKKILKMVLFDGRVDPDGRTFTKLVGSATEPETKNSDNHEFSPMGMDLLKSIEQLATMPYDDQTGDDITEWVKGATIGYGHLILNAEWPKYKYGITQDEALELFHSDLTPYVNTVKTKVTADITQNEFDAMVILTFNIGRTAFTNSSVLKMVNNPYATTAYTNLEAAWKAWNKSQGVVNRGLTKRRQAEWDIFNKGIYQKW